ncbi:phage tail assembly protein T [Salinicola aestuarinus]|uniref:phage tail assembly protein T n=1 Tax=Salinicola aestuarinus TaxID=1949082 RepID=UPI003CC9636B
MEEARQRLSYAEVRQWAAYRNKHGRLDAGQRVERAMAQLSALYANSHRKKDAEPLTIYDFLPHGQRPADSLEQAMATWG